MRAYSIPGHSPRPTKRLMKQLAQQKKDRDINLLTFARRSPGVISRRDIQRIQNDFTKSLMNAPIMAPIMKVPVYVTTSGPYVQQQTGSNHTISSLGTVNTINWMSSQYSTNPATMNFATFPASDLPNENEIRLSWRRIRAVSKRIFRRLFDPDDAMSPAQVDLFTTEGYALASGTTYVFPDGALLALDRNGNAYIEDSDAKVIYKANRIREFNPYMNASDLLETFIRDLGKLGVTQSGMLEVPVMAFIHWLAIEAAKKDGDPIDDLPSVQAALTAPTSP
jgi:hypothetical protein